MHMSILGDTPGVQDRHRLGVASRVVFLSVCISACGIQPRGLASDPAPALSGVHPCAQPGSVTVSCPGISPCT